MYYNYRIKKSDYRRMIKDIHNKQYWDLKYKENLTGWDIGYPSSPLKEYIDSLNNKEMKILIPGCGNAYEAEYLCNNGFKNVYLLDWSYEAFKSFKSRMPHFPDTHFILEDYFKHDDTYNLILEQTFMCSLLPSLRSGGAGSLG